MKKNFFSGSLSVLAAFATIVTNLSLSSCSSEDLLISPAVVDIEVVTEDLTVTPRQEIVEVEELTPTTIVDLQKTGEDNWEVVCSDGEIYAADHSGNIQAEELDAFVVLETPISETAVLVTVEFYSKSTINPSLKRRGSHIKMLKATTPPVVDEPTIVRVYHVADTTMNCTLHEGESKQVTVNMNHKLTKVTEWSNGQNDSTLVWDKSFQVARAFLSANGGRIYSQTPAAGLNFSSQVNWKKTKTSTDEAFTVTTNQGSVKFIAGYVCDAGYDQQWDGTSAVEAATVEVSYEDYSATYEFNFTEQFIGQKEESRSIPNEERGGHDYVYESTVVGSWSYSVNGISLGVHPVEIEVFHF